MPVTADLLTEVQASSLYTVLMYQTGCSGDPDSRAMFIRAMQQGVEEFRLRNSLLGFGGKYWRKSRHVSCYNEDLNPTTRGVIELANAAIAEWYENE